MAVEKEDLAGLAPDALAPAATEAKAEATAVNKGNMKAGRCFVSAMLAGFFIALGATFFMLFLGDDTMPFAVQRLVGGLCFCLGLELVLCCGAELFTGNCLMVCGAMSRQVSWGKVFKNWLIVFIGNFCGALVAVALITLAQVCAMNSGAVGDTMVSVAVGKVTPSWVTLFGKGIMCNILVCLAVWIGFAGRTIADKVLGILLPISAFVACGFEHCVANMFFLPNGYILKLMGYGADVANVDALNIGSIFYNLSAATLGNIVGGAIVVGLAYWFIYHKRQEKKQKEGA